MQRYDSDEDEVLFLETVIKCERDNDISILLEDGNQSRNSQGGGGQSWKSQEKFRDLGIEENSESESVSTTDSDLLCVTALNQAEESLGIYNPFIRKQKEHEIGQATNIHQHLNSSTYSENSVREDENTDTEKAIEKRIPKAPKKSLSRLTPKVVDDNHRLRNHEIRNLCEVPISHLNAYDKNQENDKQGANATEGFDNLSDCFEDGRDTLLTQEFETLMNQAESREVPKNDSDMELEDSFTKYKTTETEATTTTRDAVASAEINKTNGFGCPSDCSDCNTDTEVRMGFNTRDMVLMMTSSSSDKTDEGSDPQPCHSSALPNVASAEIRVSSNDNKDISDSSSVEKITANIKRSRKRRRTASSARLSDTDSSESQSSRKKASTTTRKNYKSYKRRNTKKKIPREKNGRRNKCRKSNRTRSSDSSDDFIKNSSETDSSSASDSSVEESGGSKDRGKNRNRNKDRFRPKAKKIKISRQKKCSTNSISQLEKMVNESSPKLVLVLEDIGPKLAAYGLPGKIPTPANNKVSPSNRKHKTRSAKTKAKELDDDSNSESSEEVVDVNTTEESSDAEKTESRSKTYTRSRRVKPGPQYRYRRHHTGDTDNESETDSPKGHVEFESSDHSSADPISSAVDSNEISDPDEDDEDPEYTKLCAICGTLGDLDVKGRNRIPNANWCKCGQCVISSHTMRDYDRICCREMIKVVEFMDDELENTSNQNVCIMSHPRFRMDVLNHGAYMRTQKRTRFCRSTARESDLVGFAKWSFIRWIFDRLGPGNRIMIPACVNRAIHVAHMVHPNNRFVPFKPAIICQKGIHCKAAMGLRPKNAR